ncbi:hypothetical protein MC7420_8150 [Coleofasciculus chthonoplastes PCC 7420]|uniref:Uncharacterized protein n=1 Tax=Coleofasciculus chthonoplastes PCC 7420 TaxID=118168 RepID=B4W534_9CYAN|nr:hypothetical protein MC7420_8150 [Coleofasciculus chthonoplastes PCC 7420]
MRAATEFSALGKVGAIASLIIVLLFFRSSSIDIFCWVSWRQPNLQLQLASISITGLLF